MAGPVEVGVVVVDGEVGEPGDAGEDGEEGEDGDVGDPGTACAHFISNLRRNFEDNIK